MSLISFLKDAGEKLFNPGKAAAAPAAAPATNASAAPAQPDIAALNETAAQAIERYIGSQGLNADGLDVKYDGATQTVTVSGVAPDQATKEKIVLCCGNVSSVAKVNDLLTVAAAAEPESRYHTVKSGDTLSKIAKEAYGDANAYMKIFEANKPMLSDPNKIYPGQMLRIPQA
jgi:nucleoid-associated protein YgaU